MEGNGRDSDMGERELRDALDECLRLLTEEQVTLEGCLARYPEQAEELRPLLEMAVQVRRVAPPEPSRAALAAGRERMLHAVAARERRRARAASTSVVDLRARAEGLLSDVRRALAQRPAWAAAAALLLLVLIGGLFLRAWTDRAVPQLATLEVRQGSVEVQSRAGEGWLPASSGQQVAPGARIRTSGDGVALLTFFDGSMTALERETEIAVERLSVPREGVGRTIVLRQARGRTQHRVEALDVTGARFEVRSPLAVTMVRGTTFGVDVREDGTTEVAVREGLVEVRALGQTIQLRPGWATTVEPEEAPATPFEAPLPIATDVFPTRPAEEGADTPTASATVAPTDAASATWTSTPRPTLTATATEEPVRPASPRPVETRRPPTATDTPLPTPTWTASPTPTLRWDDDDDDVITPPGPTPTPTPTATATEKPESSAQPTETGIPTPEQEPGPSATPSEERPGDEGVPTPGGPGG